MSTDDFDALAEKFGETPDLARHLIECDKCYVQGDDYMRYTCKVYDMMAGHLHYGCQTKAQHEQSLQMQALYAPMIEQMLRPMPKFKAIEKATPGKTVTYRRFTFHDGGK